MGNIKEINIRNRTYFFLNDVINIENFDSNLLKIFKIFQAKTIFITLDT